MDFSGFYNQVLKKPETIIALYSLIVSLIAIITSIWQILIQRKHNRKSLIPIGYFDFGRYENELYVKIENYGSGPLLIKEVSFEKVGDKKSSLTDCIDIEVLYRDFTEEFAGKAILPNSSLCVIHIEFDNQTNTYKQRDYIKDILKDITATIKYTNVYGEEFVINRELNWFGTSKN